MRAGTGAKTKVVDERKRPEPQLANPKDIKQTELAVSVPLPPSPTLPPTSTTDSLPSLKLETEVEFVPPATISPRKATAGTMVVHALKMGLPLLGTTPDSPVPAREVETVPLPMAAPELEEEPTEPTIEPTQEPVREQELPIQVVEQDNLVPDPVPARTPKAIDPLPVLVHHVVEPPMPLRVKGKERTNKVGDLVAHFEDASKRKPARLPRTVEQTPISALVSTIRRGFEDMKALPALEMVEEGDSIDMTPPPRPTGGLKVDGVKGLNARSKLGLGERAALVTMQLNS